MTHVLTPHPDFPVGYYRCQMGCHKILGPEGAALAVHLDHVVKHQTTVTEDDILLGTEEDVKREMKGRRVRGERRRLGPRTRGIR